MEGNTYKYVDDNVDLTDKASVKSEIDRLKRLSSSHRNDDQGLKVLLNSIYGVMGYIYFVDYMRDVARAVTSSSADLIKTTEKIFNDFFKNHINKISEISGVKLLGNIEKEDLVLYMDTDSIFLDMASVYGIVETNLTQVQFAFKLWDELLFPYYLEKSREHFSNNGAGSINIGEPKLEVEEYCYKVLWSTKKRYVKIPRWYKKQTFDYMEKISVKGLEIIKYVYSAFSRDSMMDVVKMIMEKASIESLSKKCKQIKEMYNIRADNFDYRSLSKTERVTKYSKYVVSDFPNIKVMGRTQIQVKASARYNNLIKSNTSLVNKYSLISDGDRICWYYDIDGKPFAFPILGGLPKEVAPKIDVSMMYQKTFLDPINSILTSIKHREVDSNFIVTPRLF